jgi:hypothetical protein
MAKDKKDRDTADWLDDAEERRLKEEQAHARRQERREKHRRKETPKDRP